MQIADMFFEGPFTNIYSLKSESGVYVILGRKNINSLHIIDVGESENIYSRVINHERQSCWQEQRQSLLLFAVCYINENERITLERKIRKQYDPPCGEK